MEEAQGAPAGAAPAAPPPAPAEGVRSMSESLPAALEPELRKIIDTAVARVAAIELEAIRDARELTQRSEQEAREALAFALDRAFNLINTLELLAATVSGMADALRIELDDAIDALRNVPQPESELGKELKQQEGGSAPAPPEEAPAPEAPAPVVPVTPKVVTPPAEAAPPPQPEAAAPSPEAEPEEREAEPEERVAAAVSRSNGYPPAERQAESLAIAPESEPETEPETEKERTVVRAPASQDGELVPARRRGLIRRLFAK